MKKKISISGCGWLGLPLAQHLIHKGYEIFGSTTSEDKKSILTNAGIKPFILNIEHLNEKSNGFFDAEILIIAITSKNIDAFRKLINLIKNSNISRVLFVSSTSVYKNNNEVVTEESPVKDCPLITIENLFKENTSFKTTILRFGGLFGYSRKPGNFFKQGRIIENPDGFINLIHQDDCIQIIENIISKNIWNETLNACCSTHPTRREFYSKEMAKAGRIANFNEESPDYYKIVSNEKLKKLLNYHFIYDDLLKH